MEGPRGALSTSAFVFAASLNGIVVVVVRPPYNSLRSTAQPMPMPPPVKSAIELRSLSPSFYSVYAEPAAATTLAT